MQPRYKFLEAEHIHTLDGKPMTGTSTACKVLDKPGLVWWAAGKSCEALGWLNPKNNLPNDCIQAAAIGLANIKEMNGQQFNALLNKAYRAHNSSKNKAATKGTNLHAEIEKYIKFCLPLGIPESWEVIRGLYPTLDPQVEPFVKWAVANIDHFLFAEIHTYSERLWLGGIVDFGYMDKKGLWVVADNKSSKAAYFNALIQIGGYDIQLTETGGLTKDGESVFKLPEGRSFAAHAIFNFGNGFTEPTISFCVERNKQAFENALALYRAREEFEANKEAAGAKAA